MTARFWWSIAFCVLTLALVPLLGNLACAAFSAPFALAVALSVLDGWWPEAKVEFVTLDSSRILENDVAMVNIAIVSSRYVGWAELEVQFPSTFQPQRPARFITTLSPNEPRQWSIPAKAIRWGVSGPEHAILITQDRFGMSQQIQRVPLTATLQVFPPTDKLKSLVPLYKERPVTGEHRSRSRGPGSELSQARFYRYGDPVRSIHPQLSARRGEPVVVERHPERSSTLVILVDTSQDLGVGIDTTLRWTVTAAITLAERHLQAQDKLGLLQIGLDVRWMTPKLGRRHLHSIVEMLLASEAATTRPSKDARLTPPTDLPRSSTIVAISPLLSEHTLLALTALRTQGHKVLVLKPGLPPIPPDIHPLAQRIFRVGNEINERWLIDRGAVVIPWKPNTTLEHMLKQVSTTLTRFQAEGRP